MTVRGIGGSISYTRYSKILHFQQEFVVPILASDETRS